MRSTPLASHLSQGPDLPAIERAAVLLAEAQAHVNLTLEDARVVVRYMTPRFIPAQTTFIREGEDAHSGFMALLLDGEVVVERITLNRADPVTVRVLGPGSLVGEIGLIDQEPRTASCTASTDVRCAILTREAIQTMMREDPQVAARLLFGVCAHVAELLRDTNRQLKLYVRLAEAMHDELEHASHPRAL
jgi:CRP/FNR family transcriptional regulator, cyclic AMP receptor protein